MLWFTLRRSVLRRPSSDGPGGGSLDEDHDLVVPGGTVREGFGSFGGLDHSVAVGRPAPDRRPPTASGSQRNAHWRHVSSLRASPSSHGCHGPSSSCTSTALMPRVCAQATPPMAADAVGSPGERAEPVDRVDPAHQLDRCPIGVAAWHPVLLEVLERGQLDLGEPLGGRDVAVQPRHDQAHREARARAAAARRSSRTQRVRCDRRWLPRPGTRTCSRRPIDPRPVSHGDRRRHPPRSSSRRTPVQRALPTSSPPIVFDTHVRVMSCSTTSDASRSSKLRRELPLDHAGHPQLVALGRHLGHGQCGVDPVEVGVRRHERGDTVDPDGHPIGNRANCVDGPWAAMTFRRDSASPRIGSESSARPRRHPRRRTPTRPARRRCGPGAHDVWLSVHRSATAG